MCAVMRKRRVVKTEPQVADIRLRIQALPRPLRREVERRPVGRETEDLFHLADPGHQILHEALVGQECPELLDPKKTRYVFGAKGMVPEKSRPPAGWHQ